MKDSPKPDHVSLTNMVNRLREGRYVIPDFQRDFEWAPRDINELMRSIFRDYYIGSLLLWRGKKENFEALCCEPIYGFAGSDGRTDIVLDGQQGLTAMYYAFMPLTELHLGAGTDSCTSSRSIGLWRRRMTTPSSPTGRVEV